MPEHLEKRERKQSSRAIVNETALMFPILGKIMGSSSYFESYRGLFLINLTCYFNNTR